LNNTGHPITSH
jgi:hypothetical protein